MALTYFGLCNSDGTTIGNYWDYGWGTSTWKSVFRLGGGTPPPFSIPGSGTQVIKDLCVYSKSYGGTPANLRVALYKHPDNSKICEGFAQILINNITARWWGHGPGLDNALNPSAPEVTAGDLVDLAFSQDGDDIMLYGVDGGAAEYFNVDWTDYTEGFPATYADPTDQRQYGWNIRCGVEAAAGGLSIPVAMDIYRQRRN